MIKYVNYGHPRHGVHMYVIVMNRTERGNYKVEVSFVVIQELQLATLSSGTFSPLGGMLASMSVNSTKSFIAM